MGALQLIGEHSGGSSVVVAVQTRGKHPSRDYCSSGPVLDPYGNIDMVRWQQFIMVSFRFVNADLAQLQLDNCHAAPSSRSQQDAILRKMLMYPTILPDCVLYSSS